MIRELICEAIASIPEVAAPNSGGGVCHRISRGLVMIRSIEEIVAFLREQARLRAEENDEAGILLKAAQAIEQGVAQLEAPSVCTYPRCKCIVSTSTSQPEPVCPNGWPNIKDLAQAALPINDDDWGSARQIEAQNAFFDAIKAELYRRGEIEKWSALETWCLKASTHEMVEKALQVLNAPR